MQVSKCFSMAPHIRSHRAPCSCFQKKVSIQLSSGQSVGDVGITQLDWKRVPPARSGGCKSSDAITAECWRHHASRNVSLTLARPAHLLPCSEVQIVFSADERRRTDRRHTVPARPPSPSCRTQHPASPRISQPACREPTRACFFA